jgi:hypothetical protein
MKETLRTARPLQNVAVVIEHREGVAVLESSRTPLLQRCGRRDVEHRDLTGGRRASVEEHRIRNVNWIGTVYHGLAVPIPPSEAAHDPTS